MKGVLKYLISLPPDEVVSLGAKSIIQQRLTSFGQWSLDYDNAALQLESAGANQSKAEKVEEDLEANVKDFREVVTKEKVLCTKLASLEEKKRELEEQISAIKAEITDFTAERDKVAKRKREVFDNGRLLKGEGDDLWDRVPRLKVEQERAKVTLANIEAEWSKFGAPVLKWIQESLDNKNGYVYDSQRCSSYQVLLPEGAYPLQEAEYHGAQLMICLSVFL